MKLYVERKIMQKANHILKSGFYFFVQNSDEIIIKRPFISWSFFKHIFHLHFVRTSNSNCCMFLEVKQGVAKYVFLSEQFAFLFYKKEDYYKHFLEQFNSLCNSFNYPYPKFFEFNNDYWMIKTERLSGKVFKDCLHDSILIEDMIKRAISSPCKLSNNHILILQHGDVKAENVLWIKNKPYFVDIDTIGYYPILFDVFHYIASRNISLEKMVRLLELNEELLNLFLERFDVGKYNIELLDIFLFDYVHCFLKDNTFYHFSFLNKYNIKLFPKTSTLLDKLL